MIPSLITDIKHLSRLLWENTLRFFLLSDICCNTSSDTRTPWTFKMFMYKYISTECIRSACGCIYDLYVFTRVCLCFSAHTQRLLKLQSLLHRAPSYRTLELQLIEWQERELFEYFVVVSLKKKPTKNSYMPEVSYQFPKVACENEMNTVVLCAVCCVSQTILLFISEVLKPLQTFNSLLAKVWMITPPLTPPLTLTLTFVTFCVN